MSKVQMGGYSLCALHWAATMIVSTCHGFSGGTAVNEQLGWRSLDVLVP